MTLTFVALYGLVALSLFGLGIVTGYLCDRVTRVFRRWRCQREMARAEDDAPYQSPVPPSAAEVELARRAIQVQNHRMRNFNPAEILRRAELEGLATARDKAERKIP